MFLSRGIGVKGPGRSRPGRADEGSGETTRYHFPAPVDDPKRCLWGGTFRHVITLPIRSEGQPYDVL